MPRKLKEKEIKDLLAKEGFSLLGKYENSATPVLIQCPKIEDMPGTEEEQAMAGLFSKKAFGNSKALSRVYDYGHRKWLKK